MRKNRTKLRWAKTSPVAPSSLTGWVALVALVAGCSHCYEIGCGSDVVVTFDSPLTGESIQVQVVVEDRTLTCLYEAATATKTCSTDQIDLEIENSEVIAVMVWDSKPSDLDVSLSIDAAMPEEHKVSGLSYEDHLVANACEPCQRAAATIERP